MVVAGDMESNGSRVKSR